MHSFGYPREAGLLSSGFFLLLSWKSLWGLWQYDEVLEDMFKKIVISVRMLKTVTWGKCTATVSSSQFLNNNMLYNMKKCQFFFYFTGNPCSFSKFKMVLGTYSCSDKTLMSERILCYDIAILDCLNWGLGFYILCDIFSTWTINICEDN